MATQFAMPAPSMGPSVTQYTSPSPTQYHNQFPNQQYHTGTQSQPISPVHSTPNTPQNASPTSPRSTMPMLHQHQQLRPLKSPMYVPAVLRPTDPPKRQTKSSPPTPPKSVNSSFDSLQDRFARPLSRTSTLATIATRDSAKGGLGVGRDILGEIGLDPKEFPEVKDGPTRGHWKPNADAPICDSPSCTRSFGLLSRRHHCRRCGNIFCDPHSQWLIPLDQDANFNPAGPLSRSCEYCFTQYQQWAGTVIEAKQAERTAEALEAAQRKGSGSESGGSSAASSMGSGTPTTPVPQTPVVACKANPALKGVFGPAGGAKGGLAQSMGQSVPRDWNWSTF